MPRLFISHSSKDNFEALAFRDWLIGEGWSMADVFLDLHGLNPGERWREALAKANERCEAVVLLASPASLASTECRVEIRMAEDYGKEIVVAILHLLKTDDPSLSPYRERQIVDLSTEPREAVFTVTHNGQQRSVSFHRPTLARIKARLEQLGVSPTSFPWRPGDLGTASPYPGLKGFETADAALFFGREADIARGLSAIRKLRRLPAGQLLVIQAASGAGKSSFLKAGLWPRLGRDPETVPLAILRPATGILTGDGGIGRQFAAFFASRGGPEHRGLTPAVIHQALKKEDGAALAYLAGLINQAAEIGDAMLRVANPDAPAPTPLIAVDQAEELFAAADQEESTRFLHLLAGLLDANQQLKLMAAPLVLFTLRADSMDALLHATDRAGLKPPALFALPPIPATAYRDVIQTPLEVANAAGMRLTIDPLLVDALVVKSQGADALPLLAFTLRQLLADNRAGSVANLTLANFEAAGGIEGVLAARLAAAKRAAGVGDDALRLLFLPNLCTWDADATPPGAKRLIAKEADLLSGPRAPLASLAQALVAERLLTRSSGVGGAVTLEVAHEALLRQPPISTWLEEDREFLVWREGVARARAGYEGNRRGLLLGRELEIARGWIETRAQDVPDADRAFIAESVAAEKAARDVEAERERERQAKELALAQEREKAARDMGEAAKKTTRRTAFGLALAAIAAVVAVVFYVKSEKQRTISLLRESELLNGLAETEYNDPLKQNAIEAALILLEALPDVKSTNSIRSGRPVYPNAEQGLNATLASGLVRSFRQGAKVNAVSYSPDGKSIISGAENGTLTLWDVVSGLPLRRFEDDENPVTSVTFLSDGTKVLSGNSSSKITLWDVGSGKMLRSFGDDRGAISSLASSPDGRYALSTSFGSGAQITLWDISTGSLLRTFVVHETGVSSLTFSPDGSKVLSGSDQTLKLWDLASGKILQNFVGHSGLVGSVAFSPDGRKVLSGSQGLLGGDNTVKLWDVATGETLRTFTHHKSPVNFVAIAPNGSLAASGSGGSTDLDISWRGDDDSLRIFSLNENSVVRTLKGHLLRVSSGAFSPDGNYLISGSDDGSIKLWDIRTWETAAGQHLVDKAKVRVYRCLTQKQRKQYFLPPEPPLWCITGPGLEAERDPGKWRPKWPYHTEAWREWLLARQRGEERPLPQEQG
jgi:WD40 repeat protein